MKRNRPQLLASTLSVAVTMSLVCFAPAAAVAVAASLEQAAREPSVPGTNAKPAPLPPDPAEEKAVRGAPVVSWPEPTKVDLTPAAERKRAGNLPVFVSAASHTAVSVELLGRHRDGLLLRLGRTDGVKAAGRVTLEVDYSGFRDAYGGDWASRLRLVSVPECARWTPELEACAGTAAATRNNGSGRLSAEVDAAPEGEGGLFAVTAGEAGPAGDFRETGLSASASWTVGDSSGDMQWSYQMDVPPSIGGPAPQLALAYSSGSVDGRTSGTNNQPSWAGEGFDFAPGGYIERRYVPCGMDMKNGASNTTKTGDLCWRMHNATFALNGRGGELVRDDATGTWRPRSDDGSRVELLSDASFVNGDNNNEYWRITSRNGVQFYFGRNRLPGWQAGNQETRSVWTVPVYGNHSGEPCRGSTFDTSHCQQAWRWNLDYVLDPRGNTVSYFYQPETNNYGRNMSSSKVSTYTRAGWLERIEYGQRDGEVYTKPAVAKVLVAVADRCLPNTTCTSAQPANWPDVPWDRSCTSTTSCVNKHSPTFWTQKRLSKVTTQVWRPLGFTNVKSWTLTHTYPSPGDGTNARLWLASLQHTGHVGGTLILPAVNFDGAQMNNRVDGADHIPAMNWWRLKALRSESGGEISVTYSARECAYGTNLPAPDTNAKRCHPVRWTPEGLSELTDWFNKYVVTQVSESDRVSGLEPEITAVEYPQPPAWRYDEEDGMVPQERKTWSQWRGYGRVRVRKGSATTPKSLTETLYFRGMDGDNTATAGVVKDIKVVDSTNTAMEDTNHLAGSAREVVTYTGDGGTMLSRTITDPWISAPTAERRRGWGTTHALQVHEKRVFQGEISGGRWLETATGHNYTADGVLLEQSDQNDLATSADDQCTRYEYTRNAAAHLVEMPFRRLVLAGACGQQMTEANTLSDDRVFYDGSEVLGAVPARGELTRRDELSGWASGSPSYRTTTRTRYDTFGRQIENTDVFGAKTTTAYQPAAGGPITGRTVTNALGHVTSTVVEPAWGEDTVVDAFKGRTEVAYDPLGRATKVWMPGRDRAQTPSSEYSYLVRNDGPSAVIAKVLESDGSYRTEYQLFDGNLQLRQTQKPTPRGGRVITDLIYDSRGLKVKENGPYFNDAPPGTDVFLPTSDDVLPAQLVNTYDNAGRPTAEIFKVDGVERWRTTHLHEVDRHHTIPPLGDTPTTRILDVQGRLVELRQYKGSGISGEYDKTSYTYTVRGQLATVTDPAGNTWRYFYDARGRKVRAEDPDRGVGEFTYGDGDEVLLEKDGRGVTLAYEYDLLGRRIAIREGSASGPKRAEFIYDRLPDGTAVPGQLGSSTRFVNGAAYTIAATGYDSGGRLLGRTITLPAVEGLLAGTYRFDMTYRPDGELATASLPAMGGLPAETLTYGYNSLGLPTTLSGYVTGTNYTEYGEADLLTLSAGGKWVRQQASYERGTRRLTKSVAQRETNAQKISNVSYAYDPAGNITRISDAPDASTGQAPDHQCFRHDYLRRLTEAWTPGTGDCAAAPSAAGLGGPAPYWHAWTLDAIGNRRSEKRVSSAGIVTTSTYGYNGPHALHNVTTGTSVDEYGYDPAGNLTSHKLPSGATQAMEWDAEGRLAKLSDGTKSTSFIYDAHGNRLLRRDPTGTTVYLGETELRLAGGAVSGTRHYQYLGRTIAVRTSDGKLTWLVSDHHGTAELAVDSVTQDVRSQRRTPYGQRRGPNATWPSERGFVGGTEDPSTGLVHLGAREYDASTGRFISVDPIVDHEDPQQLHGYAYANNSPVTFSDADGQRYVIRTVVTYKTVYRTTIRKLVERVRQLQRTMQTLWRFVGFLAAVAMFLPFLVPIIIVIIKVIVRYIKQIRKEIIKLVRRIKIMIREHRGTKKDLALGRTFLKSMREWQKQMNAMRASAMLMLALAVKQAIEATLNQVHLRGEREPQRWCPGGSGGYPAAVRCSSGGSSHPPPQRGYNTCGNGGGSGGPYAYCGRHQGRSLSWDEMRAKNPEAWNCLAWGALGALSGIPSWGRAIGQGVGGCVVGALMS